VGEFYVHELVAEAYLPNPRKLPAVRHKDGNVRNNKVENLNGPRSRRRRPNRWPPALITRPDGSGARVLLDVRLVEQHFLEFTRAYIAAWS
jgi:hypothetical protein